MQKDKLRFRQVHLDFHTSPHIMGIGEKFDKKQFQEQLKAAHVDSITCFSCCHHGYSYHPTEVGMMHPGLNFNLLREQIDACHEIGVNVPIYLTAGINNYAADLHPGWREILPDGQYAGWAKSPLEAGFKTLCFNTEYLDYLCCLIEEAVEMFPDADGVFLDIITQAQCCCPKCVKDMREQGFDPEKEDDRRRFARKVLEKYFERTTASCRKIRKDMPVFHNSGGALLAPGNRDLLKHYSHLELESLPTGGWGYDHYPLLAAYCRTLDREFLGMTGKFHLAWGEFGGFKSENALRYECAAMLAQGAKCSVGDQMHPCGALDESTYRLIGSAYAEVEAKEPWCRDVSPAAETAIISNIGFQKPLVINEKVEIGVSRFLLESHIPFDRLDDEGDFSKYKLLILADDLRPDAKLRARLEKFLADGGKLIVSGSALLKAEADEIAFDLPCKYDGVCNEIPNYIRFADEFADTVNTPFVMYRPSLKIKNNGGTSLGEIFEPYFKRDYTHFCSHQHTPNKVENSGYDAGVLTDNILYFAHPVFTLYGVYGNVVMKKFMQKAVKTLLGNDIQLETNLPSQGRVSLLEQKEEKRYILHALFATPILRGMAGAAFEDNMRATAPLEVIEELNPVYDVEFAVKLDRKISKVTLEPQGIEIPFVQENGKVKVKLDKIICHQMIVMHY